MKYCKNKLIRTIFMIALTFALGFNTICPIQANAALKQSTNDQSIEAKDKEPPIILIPGIMGSNLYQDKECTKQIWSPGADLNPFSQTSLYKLGKNVDISNNLYVKPAENQAALSKNEREAGLFGVYKKVLNKLCDEFPNREIYFFSYDFRKSNIEAAKELKELVDNTIKSNSVDIICHSMGAMVASNYAVLDKEKINKVISLGGPFEGAPKIIKCALDWAVVAPEWNPADMLLGLCGLSKEVKSKFVSIGELFPTKNYLNAVTFSTNIKKNFISSKTKDIDYNEYYKYCETIFGDAYKDIVKEQNLSYVDNGMNILAALKNSYFAIGTNKKTIKSIVFQHGDSLKDLGVNSLEYDNNGDGTVPLLSANMMNNLELSKTATVRYFDKLDHGEFITNDKCIQWMVDVLNNGQSDLGSSTLTKAKSYAVLRVNSPVNMIISKDGEKLSSEDGQAVDSSYGRIDTIGDKDEIKIAAIDTDNNYDVEFIATDDGKLDYSIEWYDEDNSLIEQRKFTDVPISKESKISTSVDENTNTQLSIDNDRDGISDEIIENCSNN